jgi:hypothetical protein
MGLGIELIACPVLQGDAPWHLFWYLSFFGIFSSS